MDIRQAGLPLGGVLAAFALPPLATTFGWRSTLMAGALVALSGAVAFMAFYRRPPGQRPMPITSRVRLELLREPYMKKIILSVAVILAPPVLGLLTDLTGGFASDDGRRLRERRRHHVRRGQPPLPVPGVRARA